LFKVLTFFFFFFCFYPEHALTREERYNHLQRIGFVASELARAGAGVIAAPIAPHETGRRFVRETVAHQAGPGGNFFLVHVATPLEHCEKTDRSGVYAQARKGQVRGLAGIDDIFEVPKDANLTVDLSEHSIPQVVHSASLFLPLCDDFPVHLVIGIVLLLETSGLL
jgi:sulfate adenylyltransferase